MDVETAFLNGEIKGDVYIHSPPGFFTVPGKVYKLFKSLYGLKQSPRTWYNLIHDFLLKLGFERRKRDYCLYILKIGNIHIFILIFVDDILICSVDLSLIN